MRPWEKTYAVYSTNFRVDPGELTGVQRELYRIFETGDRDSGNSQREQRLVSMHELYSSVPYDDEFTIKSISTQLNLALQELEPVTSDECNKWFESEKSAASAYLTKADQQLKVAINTREERRAQITNSIERIDKLIAEEDRASEKRAHAFGDNAFWWVIALVVVLVLMFLCLRLFDKDLASRIIEKRTLVESISMAFMLITIIILGTGDKLASETLGALMGTIAGYIFGSQTARRE